MKRSNYSSSVASATRVHVSQSSQLRRSAAIIALSVLTLLLPLTIQGQGSGYDDLDLREAHVLEVDFTGTGGSYRFDVTLIHDDDGESGYADWWQVETLDGTQLGRRTLLHAHGSRPFTRSESISIPTSIDVVVVRGHDQNHGYGGTAMVVDLRTGKTRAIDQGAEPDDFTNLSIR